MPPKSNLPQKVSPSHIKAIGAVAAEWSLLELQLLDALSETSGAKFGDVLVLAGPAAFLSWTDMLMIFVSDSQQHSSREKIFEELCGLMQKLLNRRNYIVHAAWKKKTTDKGIIASVMYPDLVKPGEIAVGYGIPKRGREVIKLVRWKSADMRTVARLIAEARSILGALVYPPQLASPRERVAQALTDQAIRRRIRRALDTLPDPSPKSPKQKRAPKKSAPP